MQDLSDYSIFSTQTIFEKKKKFKTMFDRA